jgi:hypothetical protein
MPFEAGQIEIANLSLECAVLWQQNPDQAFETALKAACQREHQELHGWTRWTPHWLEIRALCHGKRHDLAQKRLSELQQLETQNPRWKIEVLSATAEMQKNNNPKISKKHLHQAKCLCRELELPMRLSQLEQQSEEL